jgi:hypothetical protein
MTWAIIDGVWRDEIPMTDFGIQEIMPYMKARCGMTIEYLADLYLFQVCGYMSYRYEHRISGEETDVYRQLFMIEAGSLQDAMGSAEMEMDHAMAHRQRIGWRPEGKDGAAN